MEKCYYFDQEKVNIEFPEAAHLMIPAMKVWKLPPSAPKNKFQEVCDSGEYFAEEKIDGGFYQFVKTYNFSYLFGRTVSIVNDLLTEKGSNVPHIMNALKILPPDTVLIGEIFYPGGTSKDVTKIMGCLPDKARIRQKGNPIHYYIHDIIYYNGFDLTTMSAEKRFRVLKEKIWEPYMLEDFEFLHIAEPFEKNIPQHLFTILQRGGEGVVLKKKDAPYYPDKRKAWATIKVKQMDSIDLICTSLCDATMEYTGKDIETWDYWECKINDKEYLQSTENHYSEKGWYPITKGYYFGWKTAITIGAYDDNGELIDLGTVSSGLTDQLRADMAKNPDKYIGKVVALDCMSIDKKERTLRHPVFKEFREDKPAKDCLISEIFAN